MEGASFLRTVAGMNIPCYISCSTCFPDLGQGLGLGSYRVRMFLDSLEPIYKEILF